MLPAGQALLRRQRARRRAWQRQDVRTLSQKLETNAEKTLGLTTLARMQELEWEPREAKSQSSVFQRTFFPLLRRNQDEDVSIALKDLMRARACDVKLCNEVIRYYMSMGKTRFAERTLQLMRQGGVDPDNSTYDYAMKACGRQGLSAVAETLLGEIRKGGRKPNCRQFNYVLAAYCANKDISGAKAVYRRMQEEGIRPNVYTNNILLHGLGTLGSLEEAETLYAQMSERDEVTSTTLLSIYARSNSNDKLQRHLESMKRSSEVHTEDLNVLIGADLHHGRFEDAVGRIREMVEKRIPATKRLITSVFYSMAKGNMSFENCKMLYVELCKMNIDFSSSVTETLLLVALNERNSGGIAWILREMKGRGMLPKLKTMQAYAGVMAKRGSVAGVHATFRSMRTLGMELSANFYNTLFTAYINARLYRHVYSSFRSMQDRGIQPNDVTYKLLFRAYGKSQMRDRRFLGQDWLGRILQEGIDPSPDLYNLLIFMYASNGCIDYAEKTMDAMVDARKQPDIRTVTPLLNYYAKKNNSEKVAYWEDWMKRHGLEHDQYSRIAVSKLCISAGSRKRVAEMLRSHDVLRLVEDPRWSAHMIRACRFARDWQKLLDLLSIPCLALDGHAAGEILNVNLKERTRRNEAFELGRIAPEYLLQKSRALIEARAKREATTVSRMEHKLLTDRNRFDILQVTKSLVRMRQSPFKPSSEFWYCLASDVNLLDLVDKISSLVDGKNVDFINSLVDKEVIVPSEVDAILLDARVAGLVVRGDLTGAFEILSHVREQGVRCTNSVFEILMLGALVEGNEDTLWRVTREGADVAILGGLAREEFVRVMSSKISELGENDEVHAAVE